MANGDLVKLGTFYLAGTKQARPTYPWQNGYTPSGAPGTGNIPSFSAGQSIEIKDTDTADAYKINWIEVNDGAKKLLIADRNLLINVSWDDLNALGLITGKSINIDGQQYLLRVLTGGNNYRNSSDANAGGTPTNNEWDRMISNESAFSGLPVPNSADLDGSTNETDRQGTHNTKWNWYYCYSWVQETYLPNTAYRVLRGYSSARYFYSDYSSYRNTYVGWRPVLEVLNTAPLISDSDRNLGDLSAPLIKSYTVSDSDGDTISVIEKVDGNVIRTLNNQASGASLTLDLTSQWVALSRAQHTISIEATDSKGAKSTRTWTFTKVNSPANAPSILNLQNGLRVNENIDIEFTAATDPDGDSQYFKVEIADDSGFVTNKQTFTAGLKKYNSSTQAWEDATFATNADVGKKFKIPVTGLAVNTSKYIRVGATDTAGSNTTTWSNSVLIKVGTTLDFISKPQPIDFMPRFASIYMKAKIDEPQVVTKTILVSNNALDASPVWEDATEAFNSNAIYKFKNQTKTASKWAVAYRCIINSNVSTGVIEVDAMGVAIS